MKNKKKKIEREQKHFFREYASVIKAVIVLLLMIGFLALIILFNPIKKEDTKDPSILPINEKNLNNNDAKCDGPEAPNIREAASKIYIQYEEVSDYLMGYMAENDYDINGNGIIDTDPVVENRGYALKLKLNGISDKVYVQISNDIDDNVRTFSSQDKDENGQIIWYETDNTFIRTYTIKVFSTNSDCSKELYREFTTSLPRYNTLSKSYDCFVEPTNQFEMCKPFLWEDRTYAEDAKIFKKEMREFVLKQAKEEKEADSTEDDKDIYSVIIKFIKENYMIVAAAGIGLVLIIILIVKRVKK